jgi:outer membrane protein assembly factor BamB
MKTKTLVVLVLVLFCITTHAQNIREATWIASIEQEVKTIHRTQLNVPIVETKSMNLFALEPSTGDILWKYPLKHPVVTLDAIEGTPFTLLDSIVLIDIDKGKFLDLTTLIKGDLQSIHLIPESYDLVFYSKAPDYYLVIDLFNFIVRWNMRSDFSDKPGQTAKSKFAGAFAQVKDQSNQSVMLGMECPPVSNKAGGLIVAAFGKISNVDEKGNVIWQVDQPKKKKGGLIQTVDNQTDLLIDQTRDQFYLLKRKMMTAMKISDGSVIWPDFYEVKGNQILEAGAGLIPITRYEENSTGGNAGMFSKSKLNLVDPTTGKPLWPVELELKGLVDHYQLLPDGNLAIVTFNQSNSKFQIIDVATGKFKYAEEVPLKGRVNNFMVGKEKVLFGTQRGIDLVDLATGKDLLPKMQKFDKDADIFTIYKGPIIYNIDSKNRKVYKTDLLSDASQEIIRDFKFQANEQLVKYDVLENGNLFLASAHHMLTFSPAGQILIDKPFDYSGRGLDRFNKVMDNMNKGLNTVSMVSSFALSGVALGIGAPTGNTREAMELANQMIAPELAANNLAKNERAAKYYIGLKRLAKDNSTPGSFFVRRNKEVKSNYLSYVSKADGEIVFDIPLAEDAKDPEFSVQESTGFVYYSPQFVNQENAPFQAMFNAEKLRKAESNNKLGFVAAYEF